MKVEFCEWDIGRRKFITISSLALAVPLIGNVTKLFAAEGGPQGQGEPQGQGGLPPGGGGSQGRNDGTKYGKYFYEGSGIAQENATDSYGVVNFGDDNTENLSLCRIMRFPVGGPFRTNPLHVHTVPELLIFMGTDSKDPYYLGSEIELCMGQGSDLEVHKITRSTVVYIPTGLPHGRWKIEKVWKPMNFIQLVLGPDKGKALEESPEAKK